MKLNNKQIKYLNKLLVNYDLKKDIDSLTPFEASIIIEGILNNGKVKNTHRDIKLTDADFAKKQSFFENLVIKKSIYASEKQFRFIKFLCDKNKFQLVNNKILKQDVSKIIDLIKDNIENEVALKYVVKIKEKTYEELITVKTFESKETNDFPSDWVFYDLSFNGIVDFS